jgi:hypothetical protein
MRAVLSLPALFALLLFSGCGGAGSGAANADDARRLEHAAAEVSRGIDRTLGEWDAAAGAAVDGTPAETLPAGVTLMQFEKGLMTRTEGTPISPAISDVVSAASPTWQQSERGRTADRRGQSGVAVVWRTRGDRMAVVAGPIALLSRAAAPQLEQLRVRAGIEDPAVTTRPAAGDERIVPLTTSGLSWVVRLTAMPR